MLDVSPENLYTEIQSAERLRDSHLEAMSSQVERFHGPFYKSDSGFSADNYPENHYYEYVSLTVPRLIYDNPRCHVSTRRPGSQSEVAEAMRHGLNRWVRDTQMRKLLAKTATDMLFNWGVIMVSEVERPGESEMNDPVIWPQSIRIPQKRFFLDPLATSPDEVRYLGHKWVRDKEDLLDEAKDPDSGWNSDVIDDLAEGSGIDSLGRSENEDLNRKEIVGYEIWVPEYELEESPGTSQGFHGTIFTLAVGYGNTGELRADFVREPRPYYGPRWGPYSIFGVYSVPDEVHPLSPIVAVEEQISDLNDHAKAVSHSAARYKRLVFVDSTDPKLVQQVQNTPDSYVVPVSGLERQKVVEVAIGGVTAQELSYLQVARDRLDRNSGIDDAQRGNVEGIGTATEVSIASEAASARMGFIKQQFQDAVEQVLRTVAWYLYHDDRIIFPLGANTAGEMGMQEPWFFGGMHGEGTGASFDDLELEIEPYSMERTNEGLQQKRMMEMINLVTQIAPMVPQVPWVNWKEVFEKLGETMNMAELGDIVNVELAMEIAGMQAEMAGPGENQKQPRLGRDVGLVGMIGGGGGSVQPKLPRGQKQQLQGPTNQNELKQPIG